MTTEETFGERMHRLRLERGLTAAQLACEARLTFGAIHQIESGRIKSPKVDVALRLADALDVDVYYLVRGRGYGLTERFDLIGRRLDALESRAAKTSGRDGAR